MPPTHTPASSLAPLTGRLAGKRAIITGAASGIGRASALLFARAGARVLLTDLDAQSLEQVSKEIHEEGGEAIAMAGDAGSEQNVASWIECCSDTWGGLDIGFANAGVSGGWMPLQEQTPEFWMDILRVNLLGPFLLIKHAARPIRKAGGGSLIVTSSVASFRAHAGGLAYSASKAALNSLVQTSSNELAGTGVRVNAVCPGLIETGMTQPLFAFARARATEGRLGSHTPARRPGYPDDIAHVVLFLASDESSYVNGQAIAVDGGLTSTHPFNPQSRYRRENAPNDES